MNEWPHGLTHACLLDGKGGLAALESGAIAAWTAADGPLWLHFDLTDPAARRWLTEESGIEPMAVQTLLEAESRPRLTPIKDGALLAFRGVNHHSGATPDDMIGIRIWVEKDRVITSFRRELRSVADVRAALEAGEGPKSAVEIVTFLAHRLVSRMTETVDNLEESIDGLEEELIAGIRGETRFALSNLRRQIIALRRYMAPQRDALAELIASRFSWLNDDLRLSLRTTSDWLIRHLEDLEAIRERAAVTQEELQNRIAEQQNIRMYVLSIVAAIFLPLGFLTGLLGINVGGIPGSENPAAFWIFAGLLALLVAVQLVYFRMRKWF
jgi:zinc transporter